MGTTTAVDTAALGAAARTCAERSGQVRLACDTATGPLRRAEEELRGARSATALASAGAAGASVLTELATALDRLGRLLAAAAGDYAGAEQWAARSMQGAPVGAPVGASAGAGPR